MTSTCYNCYSECEVCWIQMKSVQWLYDEYFNNWLVISIHILKPDIYVWQLHNNIFNYIDLIYLLIFQWLHLEL